MNLFTGSHCMKLLELLQIRVHNVSLLGKNEKRISKPLKLLNENFGFFSNNICRIRIGNEGKTKRVKKTFSLIRI